MPIAPVQRAWPLLAALLLTPLMGCSPEPEERFREHLAQWYGVIQSKTWSCDAMGQSLERWEERNGADLVSLIPTVVENAREADDTRAYLDELAVVPSERARKGMNQCLEHPVVGVELRRMAERLSTLYRLELSD